MFSIKTEPDDTSAWEENSQRVIIPGSHETVTRTLGDTGKGFMVKTELVSFCLEGRGDDGVKKGESSDASLEIESDEGTFQVILNIDGDEFLVEESENGNDVVTKEKDADIAESDEGTFQVILNIDGDEFLVEESENGNDAVMKEKDADIAGCSLAPFLQLECHQKKHLVDRRESLVESSSSGNISICTSLPKSNAEGDHGVQINRLPQHLKGLTNEKKTNYHCSEVSVNEILQIGEKNIFSVENENHCSQVAIRESVEQKVQTPQQSFTDMDRKNLEAHERVHTGEKPFKCQYCEESFFCSLIRKVHERTHASERPFKCQYYEKSVTSSCKCKDHERTHTGKKPFKCQYCEKSFTSFHLCKVHERTHTSVKLFKCQYCEKSFTSRDRCKKHEKICTRERPFKCKFCKKSFTKVVYCETHERAHVHESPLSVLWEAMHHTWSSQFT